MKKVLLFGSLCIGIFVLSACGDSSSSNNATFSSMEKEISELKTENSELKETNKNYESILGILGEGSEEDENTDSSSTSSSSKEFSLNESLSFKSGERITVTAIEEKPDLQLLGEYSGTVIPIQVTATVENTGSSPLSFNAQYFDVYDGNENLAEFGASTYGNNIPNSIAAGKNATIVVNFGATNSGPYSVTFGDATWKQ